MKNSEVWRQNLGLCRKAGELVMGFDAVVEAMKKDKVKGILVTSDISLKTLKEVKFHAEKCNMEIVYLPAGMDEIKKIIGKTYGILAVTNEGMFSLFK
ncbi:MAG: ribosomal L7Ae/L30e/S12e/Gadd45 family protein [Oscillospiraceae bacterium]|jgi:ribosomal protein L30E|nr:ribosomal L7Ae/L30e/S12e/Gadd45 family protein [Oscillospiraceae bacterium]